MAISQTMSNPSDNWMLQYQTEFSGISQTEVPPPATTAAAAAARANNLSPDQGRVAKPIRRRSRASRRTPTTLLNTDATNFRAMVQQFTGGPAASFAARPQIPSGGGGAALNYIEHANNMDPARGFRVQYPNPNQQQHQQQHMFLMDSMHGGGGLPAAPPGNASENDHQNRNYHNYMRFDQ